MRSLVGFLAGVACAALTFMLVLGFATVAAGDLIDEHPGLTYGGAALIAIGAGVTAYRSWRGR